MNKAILDTNYLLNEARKFSELDREDILANQKNFGTLQNKLVNSQAVLQY